METREMRLISGKGNYIDDIEMANMAYCTFVGSPYAHARIKSIRTDKVLKIPGVLAVITGKELVSLTDPLPASSDPSGSPGWHFRMPKVYALAVEKVTFQGEPVAAIIAEHPYIALDAADQIEIDYEPLPAVTDAIEAMKPGVPLVYDDWGDNIQTRVTFDWGDVGLAFKEADRILDISWREGRVSGFPIEAMGYIGWYDKVMGTLTMWGTFQLPFLAQHGVAHVLRMPQTKVKIIASDIGGSFGNKINFWKAPVVALASMMTGRPVKWFESQREFIVAGPHQRDVIWDGEVAIKEDGRVLGIRGRFILDTGVEGTNRGHAGMSLVAACHAVANAYRLKGLRIEAFGVVTHKSFYCAYRGFGKDKGVKFMERVMDLVAKECNLDPAEVRFRNFIQPDEFPYKQITGYVYDSGDYPAVLRECLKLAEIGPWREKQRELRKQGRYIGIGLAFAIEPAGLTGFNGQLGGLTQARLRLNPDGMIEVFSDRTEIGQGAEMTHIIVVSDILGVKPEDISIQPVTSDLIGSGTCASGGSVFCLSAVVRAAKELRKKVVKFASVFLEEDPKNISMKDGIIFSMRDLEKKISYRDLSQRVYYYPGPRGLPMEIQLEQDLFLETSARWFSPNTAENPKSTYTTFSSQCDIAIVEVDVETGTTKILKYVHVHDAGKIINRKALDGQIHGGALQGIGEALSEELVYTKDGVLLNDSYADYVMPTALDAPDITIGHIETPSPFTELGTKGMGEGSTISSKGAIISAIEDALSPFQIHITEAPATKERVRKWILTSSNHSITKME